MLIRSSRYLASVSPAEEVSQVRRRHGPPTTALCSATTHQGEKVKGKTRQPHSPAVVSESRSQTQPTNQPTNHQINQTNQPPKQPNQPHKKFGRTVGERGAVEGNGHDGAVAGAGQQRQRVLGPGEVRHRRCRCCCSVVWDPKRVTADGSVDSCLSVRPAHQIVASLWQGRHAPNYYYHYCFPPSSDTHVHLKQPLATSTARSRLEDHTLMHPDPSSPVAMRLYGALARPTPAMDGGMYECMHTYM
jgi:hypothetical protein